MADYDIDPQLFNDIWSQYSRRPEPVRRQPLSVVRNQPGDVSNRWGALGDAWDEQLFQTNRPKYIPGPIGGLVNNAIDFFGVRGDETPTDALLYTVGTGPLAAGRRAITPLVTQAWEGGLSALKRALPATAGIGTATGVSEAESAQPPKGFFSVLRDAIAGSKSKSMPAEQWQKYLEPGKRTVTQGDMVFPLRKDELEFSGIPEYLASKPPGGKVDIIDMLSELDKRPMPTFVDQGEGAVARIERTTPRVPIDPSAGPSAIDVRDRIWKEMGMSGWDDPKWTPELHNEYDRTFKDQIRYNPRYSSAHPADEVPPAHYDDPQYNLPGPSKGYEENLTKWGVPTGEVRSKYQILDEKGNLLGFRYTEDQAKSAVDARRSVGAGGSYKEIPSQVTNQFIPSKGHFEDEPNLLSHSRATRRETVDGKKVRQVEELQSDWHQQARDEGGYGSPEHTQLMEKNEREMDALSGKITAGTATDEEMQRYAALTKREGERPPWAPYSKTYTELELKKNILKAVEDGDEYVAWTTGQQQIDRYSDALKKQVDLVGWDRNADGTYSVRPYFKEQNVAIDEKTKNLDEKGLRNLLGKEMAEKIINAKTPRGQLTGDDLTIGGAGMRHAYDTHTADVAKKIAKQYGGELTVTPLKGEGFELIQAGRPPVTITKEEADELTRQGKIVRKIGETTQPALRITPKMEAFVKKHGMSLFNRPEALIAATGAAAAGLSGKKDETP